MTTPSEFNLATFWELLHAALGLQHTASRVAASGNPEESVLYERQAIALLLEATCLLDPDEPALTTVRLLATAGLSRLHTLKKSRSRPTPAPSRPATTRARSKRVTALAAAAIKRAGS